MPFQQPSPWPILFDPPSSTLRARQPHLQIPALMKNLPFLIVGAGPAGMSLARAFVRHAVPFVVLERHADVGGIWDPANPGTPIYRSAHFISSRSQSGYLGFPMPTHYPDYPSAAQIHAYHRAFADAYDLKRHVRFGCAVRHAEPQADHWRVELESGEVLEAAGLICANGTNWDPIIPQWPGAFSGRIRHAVEYSDPADFRGQRVLIVGAGNSGCDIACDAAQNADAAFISLRRGYHFIPKHVLGMPADEFAARGPKLPMWLSQRIFGAMLKLLVGDLSRLGLPKPDHRVFESHPIVNDQLLHHLRHGDIQARGDIEGFDAQHVIFKDGRREQIDQIILATGYKHSIPYLPADTLEWRSSRPRLYMNLFSRKQPSLMGMGFMETDGGAYKLFDEMANVVAQHAADRQRNPERAARFDMIKQEDPDLSGGVKYLASERHGNYVQHDAYLAELKRLRKRMGWVGVKAEDFAPQQQAESDQTEQAA